MTTTKTVLVDQGRRESQTSILDEDPNSVSDDHAWIDPYGEYVVAGPKLPADHDGRGGHITPVGGDSIDSSGLGQTPIGTHAGHTETAAQFPESAKGPAAPPRPSSARAFIPSPPTIGPSAPWEVTSAGSPSSVTDQASSGNQIPFVGDAPNIGSGQPRSDGQPPSAAAEQSPPEPVNGSSATKMETPVLADPGRQGSAIECPPPNLAALNLADPFLALAADVLDDMERVRIANENRLRQLTRDETDADGEERGFGLTLDHPDVARLASLVAELAKAEHQAELNLCRLLRKHPLGPWVKQAKGVGDKQGARLLAAIGDPYWNDLHQRPRLVSELWSYCGLGDAKVQVRKRGVKANWNANAKKRAWLVANSILKAGGPYREVYDKARAKYDGAVHDAPCVRCGPAGKPAQPGSPLSAGHQHARGLRAVSKEVLRDLWREAKRLHELSGSQPSHGAHVAVAAGETP